jgi:hypothetical protein
VVLAIDDVDSDYGDASDEFDTDENVLVVNGTGFESTQGTGTVWLADETTLAASNAEVDLTDAITAWGNLLVTLDLTDLNAGDQAAIEALIVSDGHALFIILVSRRNKSAGHCPSGKSVCHVSVGQHCRQRREYNRTTDCARIR